ncbi:uncharacterized protein LOC123697005 [Colias croceus]|uniref:uncharacterized protein LOC123692877 n=1 Tax=Colias crocea TaxID=72248 RepID=UPI001E27BCBC|nr:uncharacterized protein LOC123692877 [Colias croceus]XP_045499373.1 uncharacterized protein LOC123697005 [Colias croceus]
MEPNFEKADSRNLPKVDAIMVGMFFKNNPDFYAPELRNVKTATAARESYGDDAIGYVQLRRESDLCTVKCKICPEHKVKASSYKVVMIVDEKKNEIISCQCTDCAASAGGCKHAVAFLMWTHRRSEEPSCTEVECYWKKSTLSRVGTSVKFITLDKMSKKQASRYEESKDLLTEFLHEAKKRKITNCELQKYQHDFRHGDMMQFSMHHFLMQTSGDVKNNVTKLLESLAEQLDEKIVTSIEVATKSQYKSPLWYEMRYSRITASKAFEASRCQTADGSLVAAVMGAKTPDTAAMKRGRELELSVIKIVQNKLKKKFKPCGVFLSTKYPMVAATPDGISKDAVVEVKCPTSEETKLNYLKEGQVMQKYFAQVQIQMYVTNKKKGYFCVAHPDFEQSKKVDIVLINYDDEYVNDLLQNVETFWKVNIYPILVRSTSY